MPAAKPRKLTPISILTSISTGVATLSSTSRVMLPSTIVPTSATATPTSAGRKRKLDDKNTQKYYAVRAGLRPGIYLTWHECQTQITGFKGAQYKSFLTREDAAAFVAGKDPDGGAKDKGDPKFYAVAVGNPPGIYDNWLNASKAIKGVKGPKYKKFSSRLDAANFVRMYANDATRHALSTGAAVGVSKNAAKMAADPGADGEEEDDEEEDDDDDGGDDDEDEQGTHTVPPPAKRSKTNASTSSSVLNIYTDGSSLGNGRRGASAGIGVFFGPGDKRNISERLKGEVQTNQRAELTAILRALQTVAVSQPVRIVSDSMYAINCVTEWYRSWVANGWRTRTGEPVLNQDLIKAVRTYIDGRDKIGTLTAFRWVKGHNDDSGNVAADMLAVNGAKLRP